MNESETGRGQILVTGGTGKTGARIVEQLKQRSIPLKVGSRTATPKFDWEDSGTWKDSLANVESVYICFQPDLAVPGAVKTIGEFTRVAAASNVKQLVLLSGRGEPEAEDCEKVIISSGLKWTIIRSSWFNQNFSESYLLEPILHGHVALPVKEIGEPFIDVNDIADVAVAALTDEKHHGQLYEVTGPRLLTFREAIEEISRTTGRQIRYEEVSMQEYVTALTTAGVPPEYISLIRYLFTEVLDGRNVSLGDGVQLALNRKPRDFSDYVKEVATTSVWLAAKVS